jgi:folate-binding protein YgfZ
MTLVKSDSLPGYENVHNGALYYRQMDSGFLQIEGPDRFDFLQRQTTNDVNLLSAEHTISTVLVSPTARILDVFNIFIDEERLGVITLPGYAEKTRRFLQSRIFFMDNVTVTDSSDKFSQIVLSGSKAKDLLTSKGMDPLPELSQVVFGSMANIPVSVMGEKILHSSGYRLLFPLESRDSLVSSLLESGTVPIPSESYHVLRVEAGIPAADAELVDDYTPLEAGLEPSISTTKGCYTGQEIIARQLSYNKVTKHLVGLRLENSVQAGERIWVEGKSSGTITSSTISPKFGPIALGYVKRPYHEPGVNVRVSQTSDAGGISAIVTPLPFT